MKVFINPGHMPGIDSGAVNGHLLLRECDIVLSLGRLLASKLESAGCTVMLLQSDNLCGEAPAFPNVCHAANNWPADIFISMHCNAYNTTVRGTEILCRKEKSQAGILAQHIRQQLSKTLHGIDSDIPDRGIKERLDLIVLNHTVMPAILIEVAFIDNDADARILVEKQNSLASAIARGITDYWCHLN
ncbi:N-acetylmuramoyl-L-alanine amidase family protein [Pectinatus frisingensis]|uniref:N-acetylmuramoyl-L-alanine amidase family protein n=1 Tax=Pectinatus frisingensis TaxID=865 RepID=UPI003D80787A